MSAPLSYEQLLEQWLKEARTEANDYRKALSTIQFECMTLTEARGVARQAKDLHCPFNQPGDSPDEQQILHEEHKEEIERQAS